MGNFFILGIRRSGTSILRNLMKSHPGINGIEFEPHPLWAAVDIDHFKRFAGGSERDYTAYVRECRKILHSFQEKGKASMYGAKFPLNPGTKALEWIWLAKRFPEAKFIFIVRDLGNTYRSFKKQDEKSVRGMVDRDSWFNQSQDIINRFSELATKGEGRCYMISFEDLIKETDRTMNGIFRFLGLSELQGLKKMIKKPEFG